MSLSNLLLVPAAMVRISVANYGLIEEFYHFSKLLQDSYSEFTLLLKLLSFARICFLSTTSHLPCVRETVILLEKTQILVFKRKIDADFVLFLICKHLVRCSI